MPSSYPAASPTATTCGPGAIARFSPVMTAVAKFADDGGPVVGICNGFQVLTEAGLLPGALQKNRGLKFLCTTVELRVESTRLGAHLRGNAGAVLRVPINHFEGNYTCSPETLAELRADERIVLRYVDNPNGAMDDIAGICNEGRNVVGLDAAPGAGVQCAARVQRRRVVAAVAAGVGRRRQPVRLIPAFFSTSAGTPASRQTS